MVVEPVVGRTEGAGAVEAVAARVRIAPNSGALLPESRQKPDGANQQDANRHGNHYQPAKRSEDPHQDNGRARTPSRSNTNALRRTDRLRLSHRYAFKECRSARAGALHRLQPRRNHFSIPAGALGDRHGNQRVLIGGAAAFLASHLLLAFTGPHLALLGPAFVLAGIGIGCAETAEHAAVATLAPTDLRGSAFGLLATLQSLGNFTASATAGILWTAVSPTAAFLFAATAMLIALVALRPATTPA